MNMKCIAALTSLALLAGCVTATHTLEGKIRDTGQPVRITYEHYETLTEHEHILKTTIDGEIFQGKEIQSSSSQSFVTPGVWANGTWIPGTVSVGTHYAGQATGLLHGSRGSVLTCQFHYQRPSSGPAAGGIGTCKHSDNRTVDLVW